ncbi:uncharacterized protein LOC106670146 [Cimex lectularius]|uniref:Uncharacterized protein n=1 Tax=Cimex lectularius TaxID=79782 RepID=A0A8I6S285_CIMLE|nr:uncharacterized protein LOC106670146 [Cimex lectularius]
MTQDDKDDDILFHQRPQVRDRTPPLLFNKTVFEESDLDKIVSELQETESFTKLYIEKLGKCDIPFCLYPNAQCVRPSSGVIFKPKLTEHIAAYLMTACETHAFEMLDKIIEGTKEQKFPCRLFLYDLVKLAVRLKLKPNQLMYLMEIFMDGMKMFFTCRNTTQHEMEQYYEERIINHSVNIAGKGTKYFSTGQVEEITKLFGRFIRLMPLIHIYFYKPIVLKWTLPLYQPSDNKDCISDTHLRFIPSPENNENMLMDNMPKLFPFQQKLSNCQEYLEE